MSKTQITFLTADAIFRRWNELSPNPLRLTGLQRPAQAYFLARWLALSSDQTRTYVVVTSDHGLAEQLAQEVTVFGVKDAFLLPAWETSPYDSIIPSLKVAHQRTALFNRICFGQAPKLILTSIQALQQRWFHKDLFLSSCLNVQKNQETLDQNALREAILNLGFIPVDSVQDPGTFAMRGDLLDIYPPELDQPVRIEIFDNLVERIRRFDPATQRTDPSELTSLVIGLGQIFPHNAQTIESLRQEIRTWADSNNISKGVRASYLENLDIYSHGVYGGFLSHFLPIPKQSLFELLPDSATLVFNQIDIELSWEKFFTDLKSDYGQHLKNQGPFIPEPSQIWNNNLNFRNPIFFDQIELLSAENLISATEEISETASLTRLNILLNDQIQSLGRDNAMDEIERLWKSWAADEYQILVTASTSTQLDRIKSLIEKRGWITAQTTYQVTELEEGFRWPSEKIAVLVEGDFFGHKSRARRAKGGQKSNSSNWSSVYNLSDLNAGDLVVHLKHGIGKYCGLTQLNTAGLEQEFLLLEYADKDKLYLPVYRVDQIQKYASEGGPGILDKLGSSNFQKAKEKAKESAKQLAFSLVDLYAKRSLQVGIQLNPRDDFYTKFADKFSYQETPDQEKAIEETLTDLESGRVMDRLICGDVGFGKTEVAMRAAFRMVSEGHQVAVLVPTTLLAFQHERSFINRFKDYPIRIESVSRFKSPNEVKTIVKDCGLGTVDILIGTHRILSADVKFAKLGLVIVDEEHRFGVAHKEKLKSLCLNTHLLTLSATPIPRTLHMALSGLREITLISTPPLDRYPIKTFLSKYSEDLIVKAITQELARGGQVFFVHNRVQTIQALYETLKKLLPDVRILVAHGQMSEAVLEKVMAEFYNRSADVLLSTAIIESGIDIPSANTIIIDRADAMGLAQLYQLRGRVGRSQQRGFAYLLVPSDREITSEAKARLETIQRFIDLGSGFSVASHDLEQRGGGDLLGAHQSGHIHAIGFELYAELIEEAVLAIRSQSPQEKLETDPEIKVPFSAYLSERYAPDVHARLNLYRRLSSARSEEEVLEIEQEIVDRFGDLVPEAKNLVWLIRIKVLLKQLHIEALTLGPGKFVMVPSVRTPIKPEKLIALLNDPSKKYTLTQDGKLIVHVNCLSLEQAHEQVEWLYRLIGE